MDEFGALKWAEWFNHRRLLDPIGFVPPAEYRQMYCRGDLALAVGGVSQLIRSLG